MKERNRDLIRLFDIEMNNNECKIFTLQLRLIIILFLLYWLGTCFRRLTKIKFIFYKLCLMLDIKLIFLFFYLSPTASYIIMIILMWFYSN